MGTKYERDKLQIYKTLGMLSVLRHRRRQPCALSSRQGRPTRHLRRPLPPLIQMTSSLLHEDCLVAQSEASAVPKL